MATRARRSMKLKAARRDPVAALARSIDMPEAQISKGGLVAVDVQNHSDDDQRAMVRSTQTQTVRRLTKLEKLYARQVVDMRELKACEWYRGAHEARYDTLGVTAQWGSAGGGGTGLRDHLPKTKEQQAAFADFDFARAGISPTIRPLFERVVLQGRPLGKLRLTFRLAVRQLLERIEGRVQL